MLQLSSNKTLFYKIFLPTFLTVLFGAMAFAFLMTDIRSIFGYPIFYVRPFFISLFLIIEFLMYRSWWQLHRVEADDKFMYITNYFKTIRYQANDIEKIILKKGFFSSKAYVVLKSKGVFGQMIRFRPNQPHLFELMTKSENWAGVVRVLK